MAFQQMNTLMADTDAGNLSGQTYPIACKSWCTKDGVMMPLSFKFEGEDGSLHHVSDISTCCAGEKNYSGIPSREFLCRAVIGGLMQEFKLVFYPEECKWIMVI